MATYRRRSDRGTWELDLGRDEQGRRIRHSLPAHTPEREVKALARRAERDRVQTRLFGRENPAPREAAMRAAFEAWAISRQCPPEALAMGGKYGNRGTVSGMWAAWQAATAIAHHHQPPSPPAAPPHTP